MGLNEAGKSKDKSQEGTQPKETGDPQKLEAHRRKAQREIVASKIANNGINIKVESKSSTQIIENFKKISENRLEQWKIQKRIELDYEIARRLATEEVARLLSRGEAIKPSNIDVGKSDLVSNQEDWMRNPSRYEKEKIVQIRMMEEDQKQQKDRVKELPSNENDPNKRRIGKTSFDESNEQKYRKKFLGDLNRKGTEEIYQAILSNTENREITTFDFFTDLSGVEESQEIKSGIYQHIEGTEENDFSNTQGEKIKSNVSFTDMNIVEEPQEIKSDSHQNNEELEKENILKEIEALHEDNLKGVYHKARARFMNYSNKVAGSFANDIHAVKWYCSEVNRLGVEKVSNNIKQSAYLSFLSIKESYTGTNEKCKYGELEKSYCRDAGFSFTAS